MISGGTCGVMLVAQYVGHWILSLWIASLIHSTVIMTYELTLMTSCCSFVLSEAFPVLFRITFNYELMHL